MARALRSSKRSSLLNSAVTTLAVVAGLVLVNFVAESAGARLDLTSSRLYSLTPASHRLVAELAEPLSVTAYFGKIPSENAFDQRYVESMLDRYADASSGKLTWEKIDPFERGREFQQQLKQDENISKLMWLSQVDGAPQQVPVYFHIKFKYLDKSEVWTPPNAFSLANLEYDMSSLIKRLAYPKKKVGVSKGFGSPEQAGAINAFLAEQYDVSPVDLAAPTLDLANVDLLIVNGPTEPLSDAALMAIDQFVLAGKPALFLIRGMRFQSGGDPQMPPQFQDEAQPLIGMPVDPGLAPLLAHYGAQIRAEILLDARYNTEGLLFLGQQPLLVKALFPVVESLVRGEDTPLGNLALVPLPFASAVTPVAGMTADIRQTVLLRTSGQAFRRDQILPITLETNLTPQSSAELGPFDVGVALEGSFTSFFADATAPPPDAVGNEDPASLPAPPKSPPTTRIVVLGSADFVDDKTIRIAQQHPLFQPLFAGVSVLQNLTDWLVADQTLVPARNKQTPKPMTQVDRSTRRLIKYGNSVGMALVLLVIGGVSGLWRGRRRRAIRL
jgi:ABC-type uncharacterized transport system involved in gliding motility auxiliary subunit